MIGRMTADVEQEQALKKPQTPDRDAHAEAQVLIIEDNADAAAATAKLLEFIGFGVEIAHTGEAGLDMAERLSPDCVLLDLGLPDMEGSDVAEHLRASGYQGLLIAVSGRSGHQIAGEANDSSFDHYLLKPVEFETLRALLEGVRAKAQSAQRD
jgi:DNA-binding response OmpR family regulator